MLLAFRCENFRSFRGEQQLSLIARHTKSPEHSENLISVGTGSHLGLRCCAIYGANASGKSNVLRGMRTFSKMVSESQRHWKPTGNIPAWDPFALDASSANSETKFEADFTLDDKVYRYGFRFNQRVIVDEWLLDITGRDRVLFRRTLNDGEIVLSLPGRNLGASSEDLRRLEAIRLQTRPNSLFLSSAAQSNFERLLPIWQWLTDSFHVISPADGSRPRYTAQMCSSVKNKARIQALLSFADVGIVDVEVSEEQADEKTKKMLTAIFAAMKEVEPDSSADADDIASLPQHAIRMIHLGAGGERYPLDFGEESAGTRAFFFLLGPLLNELKEGTVLLIDEFGSIFHTNLALQLVKLFNEPSLNPNGAQIIFATHDTNLLDPEVLRRDQVWFTEKDQEGATSLVSLSDYRPRKDQNLAAAYLNGRFGAVPFLDEDVLFSLFGSVGDELSRDTLPTPSIHMTTGAFEEYD